MIEFANASMKGISMKGISMKGISMKGRSMKGIVFGAVLIALAASVPVAAQPTATWTQVGPGHLKLDLSTSIGGISDVVLPDGRRVIAIGDYDNARVYVYDFDARTTLFSKPSEYGSHRISKLGHLYTNDKESIKVWNLPDGTLKASFPRPAGVEVDLVVSDDGRYGLTTSSVAFDDPTSSGPSKVFLFNTLTGKKIREIAGAYEPAWLGKSTNFVTDADDKTIVWNIKGQRLLTLPSAVEGSPDGKLLAHYEEEGAAPVQIIDVASGKRITQFPPTEGLEWSPNSRNVLTYGDYGSKRADIWDARTGKTLKTLRFQAEIREIKYSPDGTKLAIVLFRKGKATDLRDELFIHDLTTGMRMRIKTASGQVSGADFSNDSKKLFIESLDVEIVDVPESITKPMAARRTRPRRRRA